MTEDPNIDVEMTARNETNDTLQAISDLVHTPVEEMFPDAERTLEITQEEHQFRSYLACLATETGLDEHRGGYVIMGDLRGCFNVPEGFVTDDQGDFGHYIVERELKKRLKPEAFKNITLDSEGGTFFAYTDDLESANVFMDTIMNLVLIDLGQEPVHYIERKVEDVTD